MTPTRHGRKPKNSVYGRLAALQVASLPYICMDITVKLFASLRRGRFEERIISCNTDCTIEQAIQDLGIPLDQISIMLVNDRKVDARYKLTAGDVLSIFPLLGGG